MLPAGAIDTAQSHIALISQVLALGIVQKIKRKIRKLKRRLVSFKCWRIGRVDKEIARHLPCPRKCIGEALVPLLAYSIVTRETGIPIRLAEAGIPVRTS